MSALSAPFRWCQRKENVYLTVELRDIKDEKADLQPNSLTFSCVSDSKTYEGKIEFFEEINVEESKFTVLGLHAQYLLVKKDKEAEYWPRLTKEKGKF